MSPVYTPAKGEGTHETGSSGVWETAAGRENPRLVSGAFREFRRAGAFYVFFSLSCSIR